MTSTDSEKEKKQIVVEGGDSLRVDAHEKLSSARLIAAKRKEITSAR